LIVFGVELRLFLSFSKTKTSKQEMPLRHVVPLVPNKKGGSPVEF